MAKTQPLALSNSSTLSQRKNCCFALTLSAFKAIKRFFTQGAKSPPPCLSLSVTMVTAGSRRQRRTRATSVSPHLSPRVRSPSSVLRGDLICGDSQRGRRKSAALGFSLSLRVGRPFQTAEFCGKVLFLEAKQAAPQLTMRSVWASRSLANDSRSTTVTPLLTWRRAGGQREGTKQVNWFR